MSSETLLTNGNVLIAGRTTSHSHHATELASAKLYTP
jgi:hypothetical protein